MKQAIENYTHTVSVDEDKGLLVIHRNYSDGSKGLFTSFELPRKKFSKDKQGFRDFAQILGENLLIDSPSARKMLLGEE